jgi:hypothetical protein
MKSMENCLGDKFFPYIPIYGLAFDRLDAVVICLREADGEDIS